MSTAPRLLLITDPEAPGGIEAVTARALVGARGNGIALQLRAKELPDRALLALARVLRRTTRTAGVRFLVNGRADLAALVEADGVHLPEGGISVAEARQLLGPAALVGRSCHDARGLRRAADEGADYATLGPVGSVPGKGAPIDRDEFSALAQEAAIPVLALGGVSEENAAAWIDAGAAGIAVIRAVYGAAEPEKSLRSLCDLLDRTLGGAR